MKINLMTLLLLALALVLAMSLLGSKALLLIGLMVCAAIAFFVVRTVRMIQKINASGEDADER